MRKSNPTPRTLALATLATGLLTAGILVAAPPAGDHARDGMHRMHKMGAAFLDKIDANKDGSIDRTGWTAAYGQYFNSASQPHKPARTTIPRAKAEDYWVHRATVAWSPTPDLELRLNVNNIFDKVYYSRARANAAGWATPGDRRNATLTANYRF